MFPQRKPNRIKGFDYGADNFYFVTINVKGNISCLGEIVNAEMHLNSLGKIVNEQWLWLEGQYPYVISHGFQIMPDHIHAILEIRRDAIIEEKNIAMGVVGTGRDLSVQEQPFDKIKSLSELVGAFKSTSSKRIRKAGFIEFAWHRSFYDRVIRNADEFASIKNYILTNPDRYHRTN